MYLCELEPGLHIIWSTCCVVFFFGQFFALRFIYSGSAPGKAETSLTGREGIVFGDWLHAATSRSRTTIQWDTQMDGFLQFYQCWDYANVSVFLYYRARWRKPYCKLALIKGSSSIPLSYIAFSRIVCFRKSLLWHFIAKIQKAPYTRRVQFSVQKMWIICSNIQYFVMVVEQFFIPNIFYQSFIHDMKT